MMLTEEEAKTKWCPFSSEQRLVEAAIKELESDENISTAGVVLKLKEQLPLIPQSEACRGSGCMLWRCSEVGSRGFCGLGKIHPEEGVPV